MKKISYLFLLICFIFLVGCSKVETGVPEQGMDNVNGNVVVETSRKIYYTININIETKDVNKSISYFTSNVSNLNGYISDSYIISDGTSNVTYRIPTDKLNEFLNIVDKNVEGEVINKSISSNDITTAYNKTAARLEILRASRTSYLNLLEKAKSLSEIIDLQDKIEDIDSEILELSMEQAGYDNLVDYSTVTIKFHKISNKSFISEYLDYIVGFFEVLLYIFLYSLPFGFMIGVVLFSIFFTKKIRRRAQ